MMMMTTYDDDDILWYKNSRFLFIRFAPKFYTYSLYDSPGYTFYFVFFFEIHPSSHFIGFLFKCRVHQVGTLFTLDRILILLTAYLWFQITLIKIFQLNIEILICFGTQKISCGCTRGVQF